ncbi:MAG TPA: hypothetical protein PLF01_04410, partial [Alphaproteobacteria bacterium]|nr:hypothetical protein [Alphaproteobacteria bacterium]
MNKISRLRYLFVLLTLVFACLLVFPNISQAACCSPICIAPPPAPSCGCCSTPVGNCQSFCQCVSDAETGRSDKPETTTGHVSEEFRKHR